MQSTLNRRLIIYGTYYIHYLRVSNPDHKKRKSEIRIIKEVIIERHDYPNTDYCLRMEPSSSLFLEWLARTKLPFHLTGYKFTDVHVWGCTLHVHFSHAGPTQSTQVNTVSHDHDHHQLSSSPNLGLLPTGRAPKILPLIVYCDQDHHHSIATPLVHVW